MSDRLRQLALLLLVASATTLSRTADAAPVAFPADKPAFSVTLPDGWVQQTGPEGNLLAQPASGAMMHFIVFALPATIDSDTAAEREIEGIAQRNSPALGVAGLRRNHAPQMLKVNDAVTVMAVDYLAKLSDGKPAVYSLAVFAAGSGRYFGIAAAGSEAADTATSRDQVSILRSLTRLPPTPAPP